MQARSHRALDGRPGSSERECLKADAVGKKGALTDAETCTSDTVCNRAKPSELGLVNGEMRGGGAAKTLLVQDLLSGGRRERLCLNRAVACAYMSRGEETVICGDEWTHRFAATLRRLATMHAKSDPNSYVCRTTERETTLHTIPRPERRLSEGGTKTKSAVGEHDGGWGE